MRGSRIHGLGFHVPPRVVTNDDLLELMETSDEWIVQRTGIKERHWVEGDVGASELAEHAAKNALADAGVDAKQIDLIVFATLSPDVNFPGSGCLLGARLGLPGVPALDVRNQCTGFLYGLAVADQFVRTGAMERVLVVGAEVHSTGIDVSTRGRDVAVLFGDGAGAAVVGPSEDEHRILGTKLHADGSHYDILMVEAPASRLNPRLTHEMIDAGRHFPSMDGKAVFKQAVERLPEVIGEVLAPHGLVGRRHRSARPAPGEPAHQRDGRQAIGARARPRVQQHRPLRQHDGREHPDRLVRGARPRSGAARKPRRPRRIRRRTHLGRDAPPLVRSARGT